MVGHPSVAFGILGINYQLHLACYCRNTIHVTTVGNTLFTSNSSYVMYTLTNNPVEESVLSRKAHVPSKLLTVVSAIALVQAMALSVVTILKHCQTLLACDSMLWCLLYLSIVGLMKKATVSAATFLALEPSSAVMASNIKYYRSTLDIPEEDFTARKVCKYSTSSGLARYIHV